MRTCPARGPRAPTSRVSEDREWAGRQEHKILRGCNLCPHPFYELLHPGSKKQVSPLKAEARVCFGERVTRNDGKVPFLTATVLLEGVNRTYLTDRS